MKHPRITVVIPTYNRPRIVAEAIGSVLAQTVLPDEVVVVDDGSPDGGETGRVIAPFVEASGGRVRYVRRENGGLSAARNTGIEEASGEWVAFLDDDDEYDPGKIQSVLQDIAAQPRFDVHATNTLIRTPGEPDALLWKVRGMPVPGAGGTFLVDRPIPWVANGCFFAQSLTVRRQTLRDAGGFTRDTFYEDMDLCARLAGNTPWCHNARPLFTLHRKPQTDYNLSSQWVNKPVRNFQSLVRIYGLLLDRPEISPAEKRFVSQKLAAYQFELGTALLLEGKRPEAKACFRKSMEDASGLSSRAKALAAWAGGDMAVRAINALRSRNRGLRRSSPGPAVNTSDPTAPGMNR